MQLTHLWRILRRSIWIIVITTLVGGAIGFGLALSQRPTYSATARLLLAPASSNELTASELVSGNAVVAARIQTYTGLVGTPLILDPVIQKLGLNATPAQIASSVSAAGSSTTSIVVVQASSSKGSAAAELANAVADSIGKAITEESADTEEATGTAQLVATLVQPALAPSRPSAPDLTLMLSLGLAIGFAVGVLFAGIRGYTDTRVRGRQDARTAADAEAAIVQGFSVKASRGLVVASDATGADAESYRQFRAQLREGAASGHQLIVVATPTEGGAHGAVAANLAAVIAEEGLTVSLIDADVRKSLVHQLTDVPAEPGLTDVLRGSAELGEAQHESSVPLLSVLSSGTATDAPYPLFASPAVDLLLGDLGTSSDVTVLVVPPLLTYAEGQLLLPRGDSAILVGASRRVRKRELAEAARLVSEAGVPLAGIALTEVPSRGPDAEWR